VQAQLLAARGDASGASAVLSRLLTEAPPGFAGWTLPVEPFLRNLRGTKPFAAVLARLAQRAR
jgi:hypothetical protein